MSIVGKPKFFYGIVIKLKNIIILKIFYIKIKFSICKQKVFNLNHYLC